ncbi:MAG: MerR family transcriptional regulator [Muribaculaceae bacterium]|nr:MerR family transcriptional regulator [Muribaculaceae bacterium]
MTEYTKQFYSIGEVSQMLEIPIYTLRFWEEEFPMFNPNRTPKGTRRFTPADIDMAEAIKSAVYDKGMKIEGAIEYLNKTYRKSKPRKLRTCKTAKDAIALLDEAKSIIEDAHVIARIEAVEKWIEALDRPIEHKNIRGKEYFQND